MRSQLTKESVYNQDMPEPSIEEKTRLYTEWKNTGWGQTRFCRKHNIPLDTFIKWSWEVRAVASSSFCEVQPISQSLVTDSSMMVELSFPNKVTARIEANEQQFVLLLREVLHASSVIR